MAVVRVAAVAAFSIAAAFTGSTATSPTIRTGVPAVQLAGTGLPDSTLGSGTALILGGSGVPVPPPAYLDIADRLYLQPRGFDGATQAVFTPEGLYPIPATKSLELDPSVAQGQQMLTSTVLSQLSAGHVDAANPVVVFGYSQGATVETAAMTALANQGVPSQDVHFVLVGDPNLPNGGMLERFNFPLPEHPTIPSLGITFAGATPDNLYPTDIYTVEYDGFADYPRYPVNVLSDLNAILGIAFGHTQYLAVTPEQLADAIELPTSGGDTWTNYYLIPTDNLPLLDPLRLVPVAGPLLADLLQPDLRVLVNLGYGDPEYGWSTTPADLPTVAGLFPGLADLAKVPGLLASGAVAGIQQAISDLADPAALLAPHDPAIDALGQLVAQIPHAQVVELLANDGFLPAVTPPATLEGIVNAVSAALSDGYAALLPTADIVNALTTTLPTMAAALFATELADGNIIDAIGLPIASTVGLLPMAGTFELAAIGIGALGAGLNLIGSFVDVANLI